MRHLAQQRNLGNRLQVDSCGIGWVHLGEHPDPRTFESAKKRGIFIDHHAQQFQEHFFEEFDAILAVTPELVEQLKLRALFPEHEKKIFLASAYSSKFKGQEIPDPYYMSHSGFDDVMEIIVDCCEGLLNHLFSK